jgi:hypothetical protein
MRDYTEKEYRKIYSGYLNLEEGVSRSTDVAVTLTFINNGT